MVKDAVRKTPTNTNGIHQFWNTITIKKKKSTSRWHTELNKSPIQEMSLPYLSVREHFAQCTAQRRNVDTHQPSSRHGKRKLFDQSSPQHTQRLHFLCVYAAVSTQRHAVRDRGRHAEEEGGGGLKRADAVFKKSTEVAAGSRQQQSAESNGASGDQRGVLGEKGKNI